MRYCFDLDGVICSNSSGEYEHAVPYAEVVAMINRLHDDNHWIIIYTARGTATGIDWTRITLQQLANWGVKYNELILGKPEADFFIDDKGVTIEELISTTSSPY